MSFRVTVVSVLDQEEQRHEQEWESGGMAPNILD
jgi:hypothetical protein